jgi:hypothetical protein
MPWKTTFYMFLRVSSILGGIMAFDFDKLRANELKTLLGNIRLGAENLKKCLSPKQFYSLLTASPLKKDENKQWKDRLPEEKGNLMAALNCIVTSVLGAWFGLSSFIGIRKDSLAQFCIIIGLVIFLSLFISYKIFQLSAVKKRNAFYTIRFMSLERYILKILIRKNKQKVQAVLKKLESRRDLISLNNHAKVIDWSTEKNMFSNLNTFQKIVSEVESSLREKKNISSKFSHLIDYKVKEDVNRIKGLIETLSRNLEVNYLDEEEKCRVNPQENVEEILLHPIHISAPSPTVMSWIKKNYLSLTVGILPLVLGSFASMFVFLAGGPDLAKELGFSGIFHYLTRPEIKLIQLIIAVLLISCYGFFFLYDNYHAYKHNSQVEMIKKIIRRLEKKVSIIENKLQLLNRVRALLESMFIREKIGSFSNKQHFNQACME